MELRAAGGLAAGRAADREPGLLRDRRAARARAARGRRRRRGRRREVGHDRRRPRAEAELARRLRARELLRRTRSARTGTRPRSRRRSASRSPSCRTCCRSAAGCSRPVTSDSDADLRALLEAAYAGSEVVRVLPEGVDAGARARAGHRRGRGRALPRRDDRHGDRDLRDRQPRQGRGRPGGAEREPRARLPRRAGLRARAGVDWCERHRRAGASSRPASPPGSATTERLDLAIVRSVPHATGGAMFTRNRVQAAPVLVSREHLALADPQAVVINSGVANAATGERGKIDALATAAEAGRLLGLDAEEVLVLSTGVIGARLPLHRLLPGLGEAAAALSPDGGGDAAEAIRDDRHAREGGRVVARDGLRRRRDGEGLRDDPPRPRDDARGAHDRLPARARARRPSCCGRRSRRASTRSRSTASRPRTTR